MATGEEDPDQPEQPGGVTESAVDPPAGSSEWFSVDPSPDWRTASPGPDLIHAGMVHVDPDPGIDSPAGAGQPNVPAGERPGPRRQAPEDRADGYDPAGEPAEGGDTRAGSQGDPVAAGSGLAGRGEGRAGDSSETMRRGPGRPDAGPAEQGAGQGWLAARRPGTASGVAGPERGWDSEAQDSPTGTGHLAGLAAAPPDAAMSEAPQRSGEPAQDTDGSWREPERRSDAEIGLGVAARAADGPAVDDPPEVGTGASAVRESGWGAEPVPWTEPALPMPWPPPVEAPGGGGTGGMAADDSQELPPAPDPRWPRLFAVGLGTGAVELERGGDLQPQQRAADRATPAAGPEPSGDQSSSSATPPHGHGAGVAFTEAAAGGQAVEAPAPAIVGPGTIEQMASRPPTSASGAPSRAHANMAPAGPSNPSVSPETEGGGGVVKQRPDNPSIEEDEAAIAVREAVSRAAAQAGVDVSRETSADALVEPTATTPPGAVVEALGDIPRIDSEAAARNARVTFRIHTDGANGHGRILAVANQKGGVGKSTTAVNLGAYLALAGARILVVDLDPQGNASTGLGLDHREIEPSIYDVLTGETPPATAIRATTVANLHVLPSTIDLAGAEVELVSAMSREGRLRRALESIHQFYDTVLVDCPPSLGLLTVNALAAADELLIPIQCEYYALEGLGQLLRNVELVRANLNPELRIGGIVLTMYDGRTRLAEQVVGEVRKHFSELVYQTVVPRSVRLSEAPGYGLPIALYDPLSRGGIAYRDLAFELAERSGLLAPTGEGAS